jgi:hypothetical protein
MTIILSATPGDAAANSYATLAEANTYLEAHLQASTWALLDDERKKAALISACRLLESETWGGRRLHQSQSMAWPRLYIYDFDAYTVSGIPTKLKNAQCELAMWNLTEEDRLAGRFELENMDSVEIGPIKYKVKQDAEYMPDFIEDMIEAIGPNVLADSQDSISTMVL